MTVTVELPPEIEAGLAAQAAAQGISLQEYLRHVLQAQASVGRKPTTPRERAELWRKGTADLPRTSPLPDRAISRETIYETRG
jgi:hypothetical protein